MPRTNKFHSDKRNLRPFRVMRSLIFLRIVVVYNFVVDTRYELMASGLATASVLQSKIKYLLSNAFIASSPNFACIFSKKESFVVSSTVSLFSISPSTALAELAILPR